jgi:hypothetical protein
MSLIALLTDFGTVDPYVGSMKAAILAEAPQASVVVITHAIAPQDVAEPAYVLLQVVGDYPPGTIFVGVVDPGVGSSRLPLVVAANERYFVGPDNGIFTGVLAGPKSPEVIVPALPSRTSGISATFHGRDVFAPCAARLANDVPLPALGKPLRGTPVLLDTLWPPPAAAGQLRGRIMRADHFGNLLTNVHRDRLERARAGAVHVGNLVVPLCTHYAEAGNGELLAPDDGRTRVFHPKTQGRACVRVL